MGGRHHLRHRLNRPARIGGGIGSGRIRPTRNSSGVDLTVSAHFVSIYTCSHNGNHSRSGKIGISKGQGAVDILNERRLADPRRNRAPSPSFSDVKL